jgi:radical SAM protein with 4Fe4S-binding SPASM domain
MINSLSHVFQSAEVRHQPVSVTAEITHACNVDCEHCYLDLVPDSKIGALTTAEWKRIFTEIKAAGCLFLILTGGEVLVRRDFFELAGFARELGMAITIFTNGTLIDEVNADRIAALRPMGVEISLLGGIAATHDAIARRRGAFDKTIAGIRRLRQRGVPVLLKTVLMEKNAAERSTIAELAASLECRITFDLEVTPKNDGSLGPKALQADSDALVGAMRDIYDEDNRKFGEPVIPPREEQLDMAPCAAGRRACQIGPTGDVFPCTQWQEPIGNLRQTSFLELWKTDGMLRKIRATSVRDFPICSECELLDVCGPCMALGLMEVGAFGPSPTKCSGAEIRAKAAGMPGRSAWFKKLEAEARAAPPGGGGASPERHRVRLPLLG